ncbi:MAG TPA: FtsX-like permease family protein [Gemmatimonadaceae bacterium]
MKAIDRKLFRDLRRLKAQLASIAAVVACGVASVIAMRSTLDSIERARDDYYATARFPHVFASLERAPEPLARRLLSVPGVAVIETRVTAAALLSVPRLPETAQGYVISVPEDGQPLLSVIHVRSGRFLMPRALDEVLINEHFARANKLGPGDTLGAVINGRWRQLVVVGVGLSPEFIHDAAPGVGQFADSKHHAILWMRRNALARLYDMDGAFNDLGILLTDQTRERAVIAEVDRLLGRYGGGHSYGRADQPSHRVVQGEIEQLRVFGTAMPIIFLSVAAFLLNVVLSRLVATQRGEIATLKAFGYGNRTIARHFLGYPLVAVALGAVGGIALGVWVGGKYAALYLRFFRFPEFVYAARPSLIITAILISGTAAVTGALGAVHLAVRLPPAEGMRPVAPAVYKPLLLERLGFGALLTAPMSMVLRDLERRPIRTLSSILGVALAAAVLVVGTFAFDSARYMSELQFRTVERENLAVAFSSNRPIRVKHELAALAGVSRVELYRAVPVRIRSGVHSRQTALMGLEQRSELRRLVDRNGRVFSMPPSGVVLTKTLARILGVGVGDTVTLELLERGGEVRRETVVAQLDELLGLAAYMDLSTLNAVMREGPAASGAYLSTGIGEESLVTGRLATLPYVAATTTRRAMLQSFDRQIAESLRLTVTIVVSLAAVVAVGVIYNGVRISLSERARELASLRVLGFTRREVAALLFAEQGVIDVVGTALGLLFGVALAYWVASAFQSELYRFPVIVSARTHLLAVGVVFGAALGAFLTMRRRIYGLDLVSVLKTRE